MYQGDPREDNPIKEGFVYDFGTYTNYNDTPMSELTKNPIIEAIKGNSSITK